MSSGRNDDGWASDDDANDLLAGILDETEEEARSEQERIESELAAKQAEEERRKEEALERKRAEAKARITAEEERLEGLEKRRTMRQEALRIEELQERGEYVEEPDDGERESNQPTAEDVEAHRQRELEQARRREQEERRRRQVAEAQASRQSARPEPRSNTMPILALAAVIVLVAGAAAAAYALTQGSYEPDSSVYSKSFYEPREVKDRQVSVGFTPVAAGDENDAPETTSSPRPSRPAKPSRPARPSTPDPEPEDDTPSPAFPEIDKSGFDPFSEGP